MSLRSQFHFQHRRGNSHCLSGLMCHPLRLPMLSLENYRRPQTRPIHTNSHHDSDIFPVSLSLCMLNVRPLCNNHTCMLLITTKCKSTLIKCIDITYPEIIVIRLSLQKLKVSCDSSRIGM